MTKRTVLGRDDVPYTFAFQVHECGDPTCGVHIISCDEVNEPICETVLSPLQMAKLIEHFKQIFIARKEQLNNELPSPRPN